jgi:hypothetical protein
LAQNRSETLGSFLLHELGAFCANVFAPPKLLWLLANYLRRGADFGEAVEQIRQDMSRLTYPVYKSTDRIESIGEAFSRQADRLTTTTKKEPAQVALLRF